MAKKITLKKLVPAKEEGVREKVRKFKLYLVGDRVFSNAQAAFTLFNSSRLGQELEGKINYSFFETVYLLERKKANLYFKGKKLSVAKFLEKAYDKDKNFYTKYAVYRDMKSRGYVIKSALKFGAEFRVYEKGKSPEEEHAKWILYPVHESNLLTWHDFAAKNRVAHSTRKNLLIAIVDDEGEVTYYECQWLRP